MSSLSIAGAVRQVIVDANVTNIEGKVYRDLAPSDAVYPYIVFMDEISNTPVFGGDAKVLARKRQIQVSLWQNRLIEDVTLIDTIYDILNSANIDANKTVYRCKVTGIQRLADLVDDTVQHAITLDLIQAA